MRRAADPDTAAISKAKRNDREAVLYHVKKLRRTEGFMSLNEMDREAAIERERERVLEQRWNQGVSGKSSKNRQD